MIDFDCNHYIQIIHIIIFIKSAVALLMYLLWISKRIDRSWSLILKDTSGWAWPRAEGAYNHPHLESLFILTKSITGKLAVWLEMSATRSKQDKWHTSNADRRHTSELRNDVLTQRSILITSSRHNNLMTCCMALFHCAWLRKTPETRLRKFSCHSSFLEKCQALFKNSVGMIQIDAQHLMEQCCVLKVSCDLPCCINTIYFCFLFTWTTSISVAW